MFNHFITNLSTRRMILQISLLLSQCQLFKAIFLMPFKNFQLECISLQTRGSVGQDGQNFLDAMKIVFRFYSLPVPPDGGGQTCELKILYLVFMHNNNSNGKCSSLSAKQNIWFRKLFWKVQEGGLKMKCRRETYGEC